MPEVKKCADCGHEKLYHHGNARNLFDRKGCGVTYCQCKGFKEKEKG